MDMKEYKVKYSTAAKTLSSGAISWKSEAIAKAESLQVAEVRIVALIASKDRVVATTSDEISLLFNRINILESTCGMKNESITELREQIVGSNNVRSVLKAAVAEGQEQLEDTTKQLAISRDYTGVLNTKLLQAQATLSNQLQTTKGERAAKETNLEVIKDLAAEMNKYKTQADTLTLVLARLL